MPNLRILSVDDEPTNQLVINEILEDDYDVKLVYSGEECLEKVKEFSPNLILLDINMPGIDGYETCERLKQDDATKFIPVIILSALSTTEEKLKGYEVGAEDYIPKPFDHDDLIEKIKKSLSRNESLNAENQEHHVKSIDDKEMEELLNELQSSRSIAMDAMRYTSDLGAIVKFYEESAQCKDFDELMEAVFTTTRAIGINSSMQIRDGNDIYNKASNGDMSAMEESVINVSKDQGRFFDFKSRTIMNYKHSSILTKNMPLDDDKKYGIMKDILGALGNGAEERVRTLILERNMVSNREQVVSLVKETFKNINSQYIVRSRESAEMMEGMIKDVNQTIEAMDLLSYQEEQLEAIIESFRQRNDMHMNEGMNLNDATIAALESINSIFEVLNSD